MLTLPLTLGALALFASAQTTLSARAPDNESRRVLGDEALADPTSALAALPGVALLRDGAPLAPVRVTVRGVSGARVRASFLDVPLTDPMDGLLDVEAVPWVAVRLAALDANARTLRLEPDLRGATVRARVLAGSLATLRLGALVDVPTSHGHALIAADAGSTRGDFSFGVPSPVVGGAPVLLVRNNDDHRRLSGAALVDERVGSVHLDGALLASAHEGGVPGFATHPTDELRRGDLAVGGHLRARTALGPLAPFVDASARGAQHATWSDGATDRDVVTSRALVGTMGADLDGEDMRATLSAHAESARAFGAAAQAPERLVGGASTSGALVLPFGLAIDAGARADLVSDVGPLLSARVRLAYGESVRAALSISRDARAPTLDELYAPRGFVLGNPALAPEVLDDVEAALSARAGRVLQARVALWAGRIEDTILYLNRNAFEIAPENTGPAWRAGLDGAVVISPARFLAVDTVCSLLGSRVDATGAPLPLSPAFVATTGARVGPIDGGHVLVRVTSRGPSSASQFGTLEVPGYTLVDAVARTPIGRGLTVGLSLKNVFDVLDARDQNGLPLPGRMVFAHLEVSG